MAHCSTVLSQIVRLFPRHEFQTLARNHHIGQKFRSFSRWSQFVAMLTAQLTGRSSLRDVADNFAAQAEKLYHLGVKTFPLCQDSCRLSLRDFVCYSRGQRRATVII